MTTFDIIHPLPTKLLHWEDTGREVTDCCEDCFTEVCPGLLYPTVHGLVCEDCVSSELNGICIVCELWEEVDEYAGTCDDCTPLT